jgi:hypothetical protein
VYSLQQGAFEITAGAAIREKNAIKPFAEFDEDLAKRLALQLSASKAGQKPDQSEIKAWIDDFFAWRNAALNERDLASDISAEIKRLLPITPNWSGETDTVTEAIVKNDSNSAFHNVRVRVTGAAFFSYQRNDEKPLKQVESATEISVGDLRPSDSCKVRVWHESRPVLFSGDPLLYVTADEGAAPVKATTADPFERNYTVPFPWLIEPLPVPAFVLILVLCFVLILYGFFREYLKPPRPEDSPKPL